MEFRNDEHKSHWAKEIAARLALGLVDSEIRKQTGLTESELQDIFTLPEFGDELKAVSESAWLEWKDRKGLEIKAFRIQDRIAENMEKFYDLLEKYAMGEDEEAHIPEPRVRVLMKFLEIGEALNPSGRASAYHMSNDTIRRFVLAAKEVEEQEPDVFEYEQKRRANGDGDSSDDAGEGEG